jgi:hypothetical protein
MGLETRYIVKRNIATVGTAPGLGERGAKKTPLLCLLPLTPI